MVRDRPQFSRLKPEPFHDAADRPPLSRPRPRHAAALASHGFSDDDTWDIAAIAAFFALSNRMANVTGMRPNDEFYLMGRLPKDK
jgi:hypothetical protein